MSSPNARNTRLNGHPITMALLLWGCGSPASDSNAETTGQEQFQVDPDCNFSQPIVATLGEWSPSGAFEDISADEPPLAIWGPQGGQHFILAVDLENPAPSHQGIRAQLGAHLCEENCGESSGWSQVASARIDSLPGSATWWPQDDGSIWLGGFFLILERWSDSEEARLEASLIDVCGRTIDLAWNGRTGTGTDTSQTTTSTQTKKP